MNIGKLALHGAVVLLATVLAPAGAFPQTPDEETYGTVAETIVPVNAYAFEGIDSTTTTGWEPGFNRRFITGGNGILTAALTLPNGAQITKFELIGCDTHASTAIDAYLIECPEPDGACGSWLVSTGGTPGCGRFTATIPTTLIVNNSTRSYSLQLNMTPGLPGAPLKFRRMGVYYKLQVSPAPASATFDDVPVGHPLHRFVEALATAGITGGCAAGQFCPDANLTRGQMAVFLSTALGLHWPN